MTRNVTRCKGVPVKAALLTPASNAAFAVLLLFLFEAYCSGFQKENHGCGRNYEESYPGKFQLLLFLFEAYCSGFQKENHGCGRNYEESYTGKFQCTC